MPSLSIRSGVSKLSVKGIDIKYFRLCGKVWLLCSYVYNYFGEGNGNPLQYSCLENPRDGEAWWAAVYGIAQSQTQLR